MKTFADLTTMGVGGAPASYQEFTTTRSLISGAKKIWSETDQWMALGSGSNLVVSDEGTDDVVLHIRTRGVTVKKVAGQQVQIHAEAGENWDAFVAHTVSHGVRGLETLSGIPGTVGASVIQNIGAYGAEVSDTLVSIDFLEYPSGTRRTVPAKDLALGLRTSAFRTGSLRGIILGVTFSCEPADDGQSIPLHYEQLHQAVSVESGERAPLPEVRSAVLALRSSKGMVLSALDPDSVSCGSFFLNPIVSERVALALPGGAPWWLVDPELPDVVVPLGSSPSALLHAPALEGARVKLSAAWLIEYSGITKGFSLPGSSAAISRKHALAITNQGGASASDIAELARYVVTTVGNASGIYLVPEPTLVGIEL